MVVADVNAARANILATSQAPHGTAQPRLWPENERHSAIAAQERMHHKDTKTQRIRDPQSKI
jgi:hypothetical protein